MNKFLKSVRSPSNKKNEIIKQSITSNLSNIIKEIQYVNVEENKLNKITDVTEASNELCTVIEAMFLHGLRDSVSYKFRKALAGIDERPQPPDFWAPLLIISHKQIITQITNLTQITTEVGQCRAWIRIALNDSLLSSYLSAIRQNPSALKSYYNANAYIRDSDLLEVAQKLIEGIEDFKTFTIPTNSSLLNNWQMQSLILAGIWSPTLKNTPLAHCDDVAMALDEDVKTVYQEESSDTASLNSVVSLGSQTSSLRQALALTEDEVLKIILAKDRVKPSAEIPCSSFHNSDPEAKKQDAANNISPNLGNSLFRGGWSGNVEQETHLEKRESVPEEPGKSMDCSFTSLVESYNLVGGSYIRTPDIRGLWQKFEDERIEEPNLSPTDTSEEQPASPVEPRPQIVRSESSLTAQLLKIASEKGLDVQNFECIGCKSPFEGFIYNICCYTGGYFCDECMSPELIPIPARIIYNWDFKPYPVSQKSFNYINEIKDHPVIDFKVVNPFIYGVTVEMAELQILRTQLNFLRAYLYTCREPVIEQLQKQMWPREYMYEHIHQYSIADLYEIRNSILAQQLQKVVKFGKDHVATCWLCSQKGFVCEICNNPKALFPFDVENVFRCDKCNAVYHKNCHNSSKPCRKCERRKKWEELPLVGAIHVE
ncbi:hypothetical protein ABEB36_011098 [Hypothenemus hampei]|uniref:RUN domain-containing protein n=1 Tax=Hypothenemus hampei TaxID=57062 RepID=A0ABD1EEF0_HYPHA